MIIFYDIGEKNHKKEFFSSVLSREFDTPKPHKAHSVLFFCQFFKYCIA